MQDRFSFTATKTWSVVGGEIHQTRVTVFYHISIRQESSNTTNLTLVTRISLQGNRGPIGEAGSVGAPVK